MEIQKTTAAFTFTNVDQLKNEFSQPFFFRDIKWRVQIQRVSNHFRVFLLCGKDESDESWSINASISFRLVPFSFGSYPLPKRFERSLGAFEFSSKRLNCGISNFITIEDLVNPENKLLNSNIINFEVEINASTQEVVAMKRSPKELDLSMEAEEKRFAFSVENISQITAMVSAPFIIADIPWQLVISKYKTAEVDSLGCHLSINQKDFVLDENFTCDVSVQYELQSQKNLVVYNVSNDYYTMNASNSYSMPLKHLVPLKDLFDESNGFRFKDTIRIEAHFKVKLANESYIKKAKRMKIACPVCFDNMLEGTMHSTECGHVYCDKCINNPVKFKKKCALCGKGLIISKIHPIYLP